MSAITTDAEEQIVRINKMQAEINKIQAETRWLPWQVTFAGFLAMAALLGGGAALGKVFFP